MMEGEMGFGIAPFLSRTRFFMLCGVRRNINKMSFGDGDRERVAIFIFNAFRDGFGRS